MKPIVKLYISHCSIDKIKFFCDCIFNMLSGNIRMLAPASKKKLKSERRLNELLNKKIGISRKPQGLSSSSGLKLETDSTVRFKSFEKTTWYCTVGQKNLNLLMQKNIHPCCRFEKQQSDPALPVNFARSSEALESTKTNPRKAKSKFGVSTSPRMCSVELEC